MTWVIKHQRSPGSRIAAEYDCEVCGRFAIDVKRDANGDPPATMACPLIHEHDHHCEDPPCSDCGFSAYECGREAAHVISAPGYCRVQRVTAARRGKDPEPPPGAMDWRSLAEGMDHDEWEAKERKRDFEDVRRIVKKALA